MTFHLLAQKLVQSIPVLKDGRVCEIGNQTIATSQGEQSAEVFYKQLGWKDYVCLDISPKWGAIQLDLNIFPGTQFVPEIEQSLESFDLVTNNGTSEHLFNQASVFQWMHALTKSGGLMLHILPWHGWINHGFFNYHPILFRDLAVANAYNIEALYCGQRDGRLDRLDGPVDCYHHPKPFKEPLSPIEKVLATYGDRPVVFVVALLRKTQEVPFKYPTQGKYQNEMTAFSEKRIALLENHADKYLAQYYPDPFPHVIVENALPQTYYDELVKVWPDPSLIVKDEPDPEIGNTLHQLSANKVITNNDIAKVWRRFFVDHTDLKFFARLNEVFKDAVQPLLAQLPEGDFKVGVRNTGEFHINLDCQFAVNTPVKLRSRVRGPHVDSADEILAGMLYMPLPDDNAGGDLVLYRWLTEDAHLIGKAEVHDELVQEVARVAYKPNTAIFFVNGPDVIHGVDFREPTPKVRRYVNFVVNAHKPIIKSYERRKTEDWQGIRKVHRR